MLATEARSLDELSGGPLVYGLGTGTTKMMANWHGVDPSGPASRMEELIPLLRRLWRLHEGPVQHDGRFYHVDIAPTAEMTAPLRTEIPVFTAGVNRRMIEVAGRVGDGFIGHTLFTPAYFTEVVRPIIAAGADKTGRDASQVEIAAMVICSVSDDEEQARQEAAAQLAFYAAPRTYGTVVEAAGFAAAGREDPRRLRRPRHPGHDRRRPGRDGRRDDRRGRARAGPGQAGRVRPPRRPRHRLPGQLRPDRGAQPPGHHRPGGRGRPVTSSPAESPADPPEWFTKALATAPQERRVDVDGTTISYLAWGDPGPRGLVLVHGGGAHAHWWDHIAPLLALDRRVLALDLSGHGDSGRRDSYTLDAWATEVLAVAADAA